MKNKKTLSLLLLAAPLLLANSPAPQASTHQYKDLMMTSNFIEKDSETNLNKYELIIQNTGDEYCILENVRIHYDYGRHNIVPDDLSGILFTKELLAPSQTKTITYIGAETFDYSSPTPVTSTGFDIVDTEVKFTSYSFEKEDKYIKFKYTADNLGDYYYSALVDFTYEGENHSVEVMLDNIFYLNDLSFRESDAEVDLSKVTITKVTAVRSSYHIYKFPDFFNLIAIFFISLGRGMLIALCITLGLIISAAIAIPLIITGTRKKRENKNQ